MCRYNSPQFLEKYSGLGYMKRSTHSLFLLPVAFFLTRRSPEYNSEARGLCYIPEFTIPCYKHVTVHIHLLRSPEPLTTENMQRATLQSGCHPSDSCMKDGRWLSLAGQATSITWYDAWTNLAVTLSGSLSKRWGLAALPCLWLRLCRVKVDSVHIRREAVTITVTVS
jgi:hypothetical protein